MTLLEQIINSLIESKRDFYIHDAYVGYGNLGQPGKLYYVDTNNQKPYNVSMLLAEPNEDFQPSMRIVESAKVEMEKDKIVVIPLGKIYYISLDIGDKKLHPIWKKRKDEDRLAIDRFKHTRSDDDYIDRFNLDNPSSFETHINNAIKAAGKDVFLSDIIDDEHYRISLIEDFSENEDVYSLLKKVNLYVNNKLEKSLKSTLKLNGLRFYNDFNLPYTRVKIINNLTKTGYPCLKAQTRNRSKAYGWAGAMMNTARTVHIDTESVYKKSKEEIFEIVKPKAIEHFNKNRQLKDGIISYKFYDLFERPFEISLKELGLEAVASR